MRLSLTCALVVCCVSVASCAAVSSARAPGSLFRDCDDCPEMVSIPRGQFVMGSPPSEPGRFDDEGPEHTVTFSQPFAVSRAPITRAEYALFVQATGRSDPNECASMSRAA